MCAPSPDLEIFIADGAPGKPGRQVLKAETCKYKENEIMLGDFLHQVPNNTTHDRTRSKFN